MDILSSGHAMNSGQNVKSQMYVTVLLKLPPNSGLLSIMEKFFKPVGDLEVSLYEASRYIVFG